MVVCASFSTSTSSRPNLAAAGELRGRRPALQHRRLPRGEQLVRQGVGGLEALVNRAPVVLFHSASSFCQLAW